jgi:hypothetical protein
LSRTRVRLFLRAADAGMTPLEVDAAVATRWTDAEYGAVDEGDGAVRWLEITVSLPGVHRASDVSAEVLADDDARRLSVLATTSGREEPETTSRALKATVPLPRACDGDAAPMVKFSKKKHSLVVRFPARPKKSREDAATSPAANAKKASGGDGGSRGSNEREGHEGEPCEGEEAAREDEENEENPLAEYLAMLGVASNEMYAAADVADADRPGPKPGPARTVSRASTSAEAASTSTSRRTSHSALVLSDRPRGPRGGDDRIVTDDATRTDVRFSSSRASASAPRKSRKKASGRRREWEKNAKKSPSRLLRCVHLARSVSQLDDLAESLASQLHDKGYATAEFITPEAVRFVRSEIANVAPFYTPGEIWLGRNDAGAQISVKSVRGDRVFWMDPDQIEAGRFDALASVLKAIDTLVLDHMARDARRDANANATKSHDDVYEKKKVATRLAGLADRTHAMLAEYPGRESRFVKHVDNTARDGRRLTVLCYLNEDWLGEHGGALKVYDLPEGTRSSGLNARAEKVPLLGEEEDEEDQTVNRGFLNIAPAGGVVAMFYADEIPHEVLPSHRSRHSFTVWYYDQQESEEASLRGRGGEGESPSAVARAAHHPTIDGDERSLASNESVLTNRFSETSDEISADLAAASFVKTMMTENLSPESAFEAAAALSGPALATAAAVFGAPGADALLATLKQISRDELRELRGEMVNMGMGAA